MPPHQSPSPPLSQPPPPPSLSLGNPGGERESPPFPLPPTPSLSPPLSPSARRMSGVSLAQRSLSRALYLTYSPPHPPPSPPIPSSFSLADGRVDREHRPRPRAVTGERTSDALGEQTGQELGCVGWEDRKHLPRPRAVTDRAVTDRAVTHRAVTHRAVTDRAVTHRAVTDSRREERGRPRRGASARQARMRPGPEETGKAGRRPSRAVTDSSLAAEGDETSRGKTTVCPVCPAGLFITALVCPTGLCITATCARPAFTSQR